MAEIENIGDSIPMQSKSDPESTAARGAALSSPLRLEIVGLFGGEKELSVSDMAERLGRAATSLYHHLGVLEKAEILEVAGTRPKGKRFEAVYRMSVPLLELAVDRSDEASRKDVSKTMAAAFRMAERDFAAALDRDDLSTDGGQRNVFVVRTHMRASPEFLQQLNERIEAIRELLTSYGTCAPDPGPDDQFVSLTLALLPLRGRQIEPDTSSNDGDEA